MMRNNPLRLLLPVVMLLLSIMSLTSCYKYENGFTDIHHYNRNYNFVVKVDSMIIYENPDTSIYDSTILYRGDQLVVAEIKTISNDTIDSVWVKLARDQMSQGWTRECDLLNSVAPDDPISQFIDMFSNNHLLLFLALVVIVTASYGLRKLYRRDAFIVHLLIEIFKQISNIILCCLCNSFSVSVRKQRFFYQF